MSYLPCFKCGDIVCFKDNLNKHYRIYKIFLYHWCPCNLLLQSLKDFNDFIYTTDNSIIYADLDLPKQLSIFDFGVEV